MDKIDIELIWSVIKDVVMPNVSILIFNAIVYALLGLVLAIVLIIVYSKKKVFFRKPKYYNWGVKLYIPLLILAFLYLFGQIGVIKGIEKVLYNEKEVVIDGIYDEAVYLTFETEESKDQFFYTLKELTQGVRFVADSIPKYIDSVFINKDSGVPISNALVSKLYQEYREDIYGVVGYAMFNVAVIAASKGHVDIIEDMSYEEFCKVVDILILMSSEDLEGVIKTQLIDWYLLTVNIFTDSFLKTLWILVFVILVIPLFEFLIYKKWVEPKYETKKGECIEK